MMLDEDIRLNKQVDIIEDLYEMYCAHHMNSFNITRLVYFKELLIK